MFLDFNQLRFHGVADDRVFYKDGEPVDSSDAFSLGTDIIDGYCHILILLKGFVFFHILSFSSMRYFVARRLDSNSLL